MIKISKNYLTEKGFMTVSNAVKLIVQKYNITDRDIEGKIYRTILDLAHKGEFKGRKYKHEKSRIWEISEDVIPFIEQKFNLTDSSTNNEKILQTKSDDDNYTLKIIRTLVNSCLKGKISKEQCFYIIDDLLNKENK